MRAMRADRIEARVEPERAKRIRYAAKLAHTSTSAFVVDAAAERAEQVIAEQRETVVPAQFFDSLLKALDEGASEPSLRRAATRARRAVKRR
jgi:uncharacterized protein (DUF1778 family)